MGIHSCRSSPLLPSRRTSLQTISKSQQQFRRPSCPSAPSQVPHPAAPSTGQTRCRSAATRGIIAKGGPRPPVQLRRWSSCHGSRTRHLRGTAGQVTPSRWQPQSGRPLRTPLPFPTCCRRCCQRAHRGHPTHHPGSSPCLSPPPGQLSVSRLACLLASHPVGAPSRCATHPVQAPPPRRPLASPAARPQPQSRTREVYSLAPGALPRM